MLVARLVAAAALAVALTPTGSAEEPASSPSREQSDSRSAVAPLSPLDLGSSLAAGSVLAGRRAGPVRNYTNVSPEVINSTWPADFDAPAVTYPLGVRGERTTYYDGCNWTTCDGDFCTSTLRSCGAAWSLWEITLEIEPGATPATKPHARTEPQAGLWISKSVTIPDAGGWAAREDYFGGRLHARIPLAAGGRLAGVIRGDVVALPGSNPFRDFGAAKAVEAYGGLELVVVTVGRVDVAVAAAGGSVIPFATFDDGAERPPSQGLVAGGVVAHDYRTGAWGAVLVGQYDAAGPGTRLVASVHYPIKAGFAFGVDYVSGAGGWLRPGAFYVVSW